jgi:hypothetical protein
MAANIIQEPLVQHSHVRIIAAIRLHALKIGNVFIPMDNVFRQQHVLNIVVLVVLLDNIVI